MIAGQDGIRSVSSKQKRDLEVPLVSTDCRTLRIDRSHHLLFLQVPASAQHDSVDNLLIVSGQSHALAAAGGWAGR